MGTLHEYQDIFLIISRLVLFIMRNVSDKICKRRKHKFYVQFPFSERRAVYEIMRNTRNTVDPGRKQVTIWRIACWIPKAKIVLSEYVILTAFRCKNGFMNAPQCEVVLTLLVFFIYFLTVHLSIISVINQLKTQILVL